MIRLAKILEIPDILNVTKACANKRIGQAFIKVANIPFIIKN